MAADIAEGEEEEWRKSHGGEWEVGLFSFQPERAELSVRVLRMVQTRMAVQGERSRFFISPE